MSTKGIVLRQHIRGSESGPVSNLALSVTEQQLSYGIILDPVSERLEVVDQDTPKSAVCARIHTQHGLVCIEAIEPVMKVQSLPIDFSGTLGNGIMPLMISNPNERVLYQIHPGESLFIGSYTISIVPECRETSILSPTYDSFRTHKSQDVNQLPSSPKLLQNSTPSRIRSMLSFPAPSNNHEVLNTTPSERSTNSTHDSSQEHSRISLLNVILDISGKPCAESCLEVPSTCVLSTIDAITKREGQQVHEMSRLQNDKSTNDVAVDGRVTYGTVHDEEEEVDGQSGAAMNSNRTLPMKVSTSCSIKDQFQEDSDSEAYKAVKGISGKECTHSHPLEEVIEASSKRQKLTGNFGGSLAEESQESLRSNIIVEEPQQLQIRTFEEATPVNLPSLSQKDSIPIQSQLVNIRILFANSTSIADSEQFMSWLEKRGVKQVFKVKECTTLCISKSAGLKKTSKLILAVLQGKQIITDDWVVQSVSANKLLDFEDFKATDPKREAEWGIDLGQAIERGKHMTPKPFNGWNIAFTPTAKKDIGHSGFADLKEIVLFAGAKSCSGVLPKKSSEEHLSTMIIACRNDPASAKLKGTWRLFHRDIIGLSSLRGQVDVDSDEFLVSGE